MIFFTNEHEYIRIEGDTGTVGITDYAQKALGDIVYAETPKEGAMLEKGGQAGVVESVKSASEIYAPVTGTVVAINPLLADDPAQINQDPEGTGWFYKIKLSAPEELKSLKDDAAYKTYIAGLHA